MVIAWIYFRTDFVPREVTTKKSQTVLMSAATVQPSAEVFVNN